MDLTSLVFLLTGFVTGMVIGFLSGAITKFLLDCTLRMMGSYLEWLGGDKLSKFLMDDVNYLKLKEFKKDKKEEKEQDKK